MFVCFFFFFFVFFLNSGVFVFEDFSVSLFLFWVCFADFVGRSGMDFWKVETLHFRLFGGILISWLAMRFCGYCYADVV